MYNHDQIVQYVTGNMPTNEIEAFEAAIQQSSELQTEIDNYRQIWILTNQLEYTNRHTLDGWRQLSKTVKAPMKILGFDWRKVAASILFLAAFSFLLFTINQPNSLIVADGIETVDLSDQTTVVLENNSTLKIDESFGTDTRRVKLEGKAYFDVAHNPQKPFVVDIASGTISVLGTRFQVTSVGTNSFAIELYEGSVEFESNLVKNEIIKLTPGQELYVTTNGRTTVRSIELTSHTIGSDQIICYDKSLHYILHQLKLVYGLDFNVNRRFLNEHYTVTLPTKDITSCIQILSEISDRKFAVINSQIVIK